MIWFNRIGLRIARRAPWVAPLVFAPLAPLVRSQGERLVTRLAARTTPPDRSFFESPAHVRAFTETMREAFQNGGRGAAADARIYGRPWGFRLEDVDSPVLLWHGERDRIVPVAFARYVAERLPRCRARFYPEEGHFSLAVDRVATLLAELVDGEAEHAGSGG
jgi:pimeloyl-ACP methyl ester carboxylesterase